MISLRLFIEQQLNEIDFLRACYESTGEFHLDDLDAINEAKDFLEGKTDELHRNLCFSLKIPLNQKETNVEFQFVYPLRYPEMPVDIQLRTYFPRETHLKLTDALKEFLQEKINTDMPYVMEFVSWIQEHEDLFLSSSSTTTNKTEKKSSTFSRLWIYSHHIFSTEKRRNILHWAQQLNLNGFSLPGKPGIICVEGDDDDLDQYWTRLRNLNWKKLQIKERQRIESIDGKFLFRFENFRELNFVHDGTAKGDFGLFYQYLQEKHCEDIFHLYFGIDGTEKK